MEKLYEIKKALLGELDNSETAKSGKLKGGELEAIHKLTDTIKNIDKICMLEEEGGYSEEGGYGRGSSYANRGQHWVRGHYSRDGGNMDGGQDGYSGRRGGGRGGRGGYSRNGGYSQDDGRSEMMEHLEMAMDAANDQDRENIKRWMRQLENA